MTSFLGEGIGKALGVIVASALAIPLMIAVEAGTEWVIAQYALLIVHENSEIAVWLVNNIDKAALHVLSFVVAAFIIQAVARAIGRRLGVKESVSV